METKTRLKGHRKEDEGVGGDMLIYRTGHGNFPGGVQIVDAMPSLVVTQCACSDLLVEVYELCD